MTKETFWTFEQAVNMLLCGVEEIADKTIASDDYDAKSTEDVRFAMRCVEAGIEISSPIEAEESLIAATENGRVDFRGDSDNLQHGLFRKADVLRLAHELSDGEAPRDRWHVWRKISGQSCLLLSDAVRLLVQARIGGDRGEEVAALMPFSWWRAGLTPERARVVREAEKWAQAALLGALQADTIKALMPGNAPAPARQDWCTTEPEWQANALGAWGGLTLLRSAVLRLADAQNEDQAGETRQDGGFPEIGAETAGAADCGDSLADSPSSKQNNPQRRPHGNKLDYTKALHKMWELRQEAVADGVVLPVKTAAAIVAAIKGLAPRRKNAAESSVVDKLRCEYPPYERRQLGG